MTPLHETGELYGRVPAPGAEVADEERGRGDCPVGYQQTCMPANGQELS